MFPKIVSVISKSFSTKHPNLESLQLQHFHNFQFLLDLMTYTTTLTMVNRSTIYWPNHCTGFMVPVWMTDKSAWFFCVVFATIPTS